MHLIVRTCRCTLSGRMCKRPLGAERQAVVEMEMVFAASAS